MKIIIALTTLVLLSFSSVAQYSGTYLENLFIKNSPAYAERNITYGIPFPNGGGLGVSFADSLNTQVQWVKLDAQGNPTFYSSHLVGDSVNVNERILTLFDDGINQYIVTLTFNLLNNSGVSDGIHIYKFLNYTDTVGRFYFPIQCKNQNYPVYFENDNLFAFLRNSQGLNQIVVNSQNLSLISADLINTSLVPESSSDFNFSFVRFENDSTRQFYTIQNSVFYRVNIQNSTFSTVEQVIDGLSLLAIQPQENKLKVFTYSSGINKLKTYAYNFDAVNSILIPTDSIPLTNINSPTTLLQRNLGYQRIGQDEYLLNASTRKIYEYQNGILIDSIDIDLIKVLNFDQQNGYLFLSGIRSLFGQGFTDRPMNGLSLKLNFMPKLGEDIDYQTTLGNGLNQLSVNVGQVILNNFAQNDSEKFGQTVFTISQSYVGKVQNELKGFLKGVYHSTYKPGPYTQKSFYDQYQISKYNNVNYVDLNMVNAHVAAFNSGSITYEIPKSILNWPAHGDITKGQNANLASFIDVNDNGIYEPTLGDYPAFPGDYCVLNITHQHQEDFDNKGSGLELHTYLYGFNCNDSINDALFIKTEVYNRSDMLYDSLLAGLHVDFNIGGAFDDFVGTNVKKGMIYGYNADDFDDDFLGKIGLKDSLRSAGILFLKGSQIAGNNLDDSPGIGAFQTVNGFGFNDGIIDNEFKGLEYSAYYTNGVSEGVTDPDTSTYYYNTLSGKWTFGDSKYFGGSGYSPWLDSIQTRYVYQDDSDPLLYGTNGENPGYIWSEVSAGSPINKDKRMIGSFGSTPLAPGQKITYHSAVLISKRIPGFLVSNQDLFAKAGHIRRVFEANQTDCGQTFGNLTEEMITGLAPAPEMLDMNIYPNPFTDIIQIEAADFGGEVLVQIFDLQGKEVFRSSEKTSLFSLNLASQDAGMYLLQLSNEKGKSIGKIQKVK